MPKNINKLYEAALNGNITQLNQLLDMGIDVNCTIEVFTEYDPPTGFLRMEVSPDYTTSFNGYNISHCESALHAAAKAGKIECMQVLLSKGAKISCDIFGESPLADAVRYNHLECARLLLEAGDNPNRLSDIAYAVGIGAMGQDTTPFVDAVRGKNAEMAFLLFSHGGDINELIKNNLLVKFSNSLNEQYSNYYEKISSVKINLSHIGITPELIDAFYRLSKFIIIDSLDLSNNNVNDSCIEQYVPLFLLPTLKIINLSQNYITYTGVRRLTAQLAKHTSLTILDLSDNLINCTRELLEKLQKELSHTVSLKTVKIEKNFLDKSCKSLFQQQVTEGNLNIFMYSFFQTQITTVQSLLNKGIYINRQKWVVGLFCKKDSEHAMIYMERMRKNGQRVFERYHITAEGIVGIAHVQIDDISLKFFNPEHYHKQIWPINEVNGRILKDLIKADKTKSINFSKYYPSSSKGKVNCLVWCVNKLKEIDINIDPSLFGLPSHTAKGSKCILM